MHLRQFTSIQVATGAYVYICLLALCQLDACMDGWTDTVDGRTYANTIISTLILFKTLSNVLVFFSLEALFLGKALAQIFSVLSPSLLGH